ncbi:MAG: hypothetical protein K2K53_01715, partial [Oscillospiraceae bacterium]|nr:hypothetical protein [Oscillospiraceae bacterium]
ADHTSVPEIAAIGEPARPDIAPEDPNGATEPGMKTDGGYEITSGEMTSYFFLPYIEYGMAEYVAEMSLDWGLPRGCTRRDLAQADIDALFGGAKTLSDHLAWGGCEVTGWAAWYEDGSFWGLFLNGYMGPLDHFELALTVGDTCPPSCIGYGDGVVNELWDTPVTAYGHNGQNGCDRRVEFLKDGYGFRFDITGSDVERTDNIVSRITRWLLVEGLETGALTPDGAVLANPWEADPGFSVGEPNWEDSVSDYDSDCPYCADGTVHTHPYAPSKAADPGCNAPN